MKTTGIVRRIDDLGRVVIPKEIRRTMKISSGDALEIYVGDNAVCFKKYDPIDIDKWEIAKNVIRHLLINGFSLANITGDVITQENVTIFPYTEEKTPIGDKDVVGYLITPKDLYTSGEIAAALKIAEEILLS